MSFYGQPPKWYHLVWTTSERYPRFKIAPLAHLCERALRAAAASQGWTLDTVLISDRQVHILVATPAETPSQIVPRVLLGSAEEMLKEAGLGAGGLPVFAQRGWCVPLASNISAAAVRRHLRRRKQRSGTSP